MLRFLALPTLRARWVAFVGVLLTVAAAVALVTACGILLESGIRGGIPPERLSGAPIVVAGHQAITEHHGHGDDAETIHTGVLERVRLDDGVVSRIALVRGVAAAVPELTFPAVVVGADGEQLTGPAGSPSWGHAWSSAGITPFALRAGRAPAAADEVVVDSELAARGGLTIGRRVTVVAAGAPRPATVVGVAAPGGFGLRKQAAVFFTDAEAARLHGHPGRVDAVAVTLSDGTDVGTVTRALRAELGDVAVLTGDRRGRAEFLDGVHAGTRLIAVSGSLGGIAVFVAVFVVAGMLTVLIQQRQREIALFRAVGATSRQVRRMIRAETLAVTLVGALIGLAPGVALAGVLTHAMQDKGIVPTTFETQSGIVPLAAAVVAALLVAVLASSVAGRRAARVKPVEALVGAALPSRRLGVWRALIGVVALAGAAVLCVMSASTSAGIAQAIAPGIVMALVIVVGLFSPFLTAAGASVFGLGARLIGAGGFLAAVNARTGARRLASAVTPLALAVAVAGLTVFQQTTIAHETTRQGEDRLVADRVLSGGPAGLRPEAVDRIAALPGVAGAVGLLATTVYAGTDLADHPAQAVTAHPLEPVLDLDVRDGALADLGPGRVALGDDLASELGARVGQPVRFRLGDGTEVRPTVAAIYQRPLGFGEAVLQWSDIAEHVSDRVIGTVLVRSDPTSPITEAAWARSVAEYPGARSGGAEIVRDAEDANATTNAWVSYLLLGMVIAFAAIAVVNTLTLTTADRLREFGSLRMVGTTRRQVLRMVRWEALIIVALGCAMGGAVAAAAVVPFTKALTGSYTPHVPLPYVAVLLAAAAVVALAGSLVPARVALRTRPIAAIGLRD